MLFFIDIMADAPKIAKFRPPQEASDYSVASVSFLDSIKRTYKTILQTRHIYTDIPIQYKVCQIGLCHQKTKQHNFSLRHNGKFLFAFE